MDKKLRLRLILVVAGGLLLFRIYKDKTQTEYYNAISGQTMGTITYNVKYSADERIDYKENIDSLLRAFNLSLSTYIKNSEISRFNKTDTFAYESGFFLPVLSKAKEVYDATNGAFDPTIGPLVNVWGFGPDKKPKSPDSTLVDSLRSLVNYKDINFDDNLVMKRSNMYLDFGAIAKGYAVDVVADYLTKRGSKNYMVEIGGEIVTKGASPSGNEWLIAIEDPLVDPNERKVFATVMMQEMALATSGNYRNYYMKDGKMIAHTIDPRTGYPAIHELLSVSVFASSCMEADAYATGFMVMGFDKSKALIEANPEIEAMMIYKKENDSIMTYVSESLKYRINLN